MNSSSLWEAPTDVRELAAAYRVFFSAGKELPDPLTSKDLSEKHASSLRSLISSTDDTAPFIEVADIAFDEAKAQYESESGPAAHGIKPIRDSALARAMQDTIRRSFGATTFGLLWISALTRLRPAMISELLAIFPRADELFRYIRIYDERGWEYGLGQYFEDCASVLRKRRSEMIDFLEKGAGAGPR